MTWPLLLVILTFGPDFSIFLGGEPFRCFQSARDSFRTSHSVLGSTLGNAANTALEAPAMLKTMSVRNEPRSPLAMEARVSMASPKTLFERKTTDRKST